MLNFYNWGVNPTLIAGSFFYLRLFLSTYTHPYKDATHI